MIISFYYSLGSVWAKNTPDNPLTLLVMFQGKVLITDWVYLQGRVQKGSRVSVLRRSKLVPVHKHATFTVDRVTKNHTVSSNLSPLSAQLMRATPPATDLRRVSVLAAYRRFLHATRETLRL